MLNFIGILSVAGILIIGFYELRKLKQAKASLRLCLVSFFVTAIFNFFLFLLGTVISSAMLGSEQTSLIFLCGIFSYSVISYFRFRNKNFEEYVNGKDLSKDKKFQKDMLEKKVQKEKTTKELADEDVDNGIFACFAIAILNSVIIIFLIYTEDAYEPSVFYYRFIDPVIFILLAIWSLKKEPFIPLLISASLFFIGKYMFIADIVDRFEIGSRGNYGLGGMSLLIAYFLVRGVYASYLIKFKKIK